MNLRLRSRLPCVLAAVAVATAALAETPQRTTVCSIAADPAVFNRKLVEVTGFFSHGFEDSALFDPSCRSRLSIWIEYGGNSATGTTYCCGVPSSRNRKEPLAVDGLKTSLQEDAPFREFDRLLHRPADSVVRATAVGRFFSGRSDSRGDWGGFGHMGCCSLFVIERVLAVEPQNRADLDYRASADQPDLRGIDCVRYLSGPDETAGAIGVQKQAETNEPWRFAEPQRVALELIEKVRGTQGDLTPPVRKSAAQGRTVYTTRLRGGRTRYMVVVSRPAWLLPYAADPNRVAWVAIAGYEWGGPCKP